MKHKAAPDWKAEFWHLLLNADEQRAITIKRRQFPGRLFKLTRLTDYALDSLKNEYLYLAPINLLNEPFENSLALTKRDYVIACMTQKKWFDDMKKTYGVEFTEKEICRILESPYPYRVFVFLCEKKGALITTSEDHFCSKYTTWADSILDQQRNLNICCLTERLDSVKMWSDYADQHRGICIEYDFSRSENTIYALMPVIYTVEAYQMNATKAASFNVKMSALTKSKRLQYEQEWRIMIIDKNPRKEHNVKATCIYIGSKINEADFPLLVQLMNLKIPIKQVVKHPIQNKMVVNEIDLEAFKYELLRTAPK